ncbi:uncharacterized protein LOC122277062 [Carya illinoinensis]|uniref:uncharacterized protein LOC122277062 n=1 Tax=Carya illinoinensis TaxID=32201 RepID=UPI001C71A44F|nr:uncharacterized protein LOC122277062 [Carya illinoinensis]
MSYSVLVNGKPGQKIFPIRGLRQDDPLSPYLFILCAKGLSSMLNNSDREGDTRGVAVVRGGIRVNHILFADDCMLFGRARLDEWLKIQRILSRYEKASGQFLNRDKTSIFFSSNTKTEDKRDVLAARGATVRGNFERYLGLPTMIGRSKYNTFKCIKESVAKNQQLEEWVFVECRKGNINKGSAAGNSNLHYEHLQVTKETMSGAEHNVCKVLVGK